MLRDAGQPTTEAAPLRVELSARAPRRDEYLLCGVRGQIGAECAAAHRVDHRPVCLVGTLERVGAALSEGGIDVVYFSQRGDVGRRHAPALSVELDGSTQTSPGHHSTA